MFLIAPLTYGGAAGLALDAQKRPALYALNSATDAAFYVLNSSTDSAAALQGSLVFDAHAQHTGPAELAKKKMASPSLSRTEDGEGKGDSSSSSSDAEAGDTPNETQPSPTFSSFAPKHQRRAGGGGVPLPAASARILA
jgi:hypothetical protein